MSGENVDLNVTQGSSFNIRISCLDDNNNAVDLTNYGIRGVVKQKYSDTDIILNLNPIIHDATGGLVDILLTPNQTNNLPVTIGVYDIEKYDLSGTGYVEKIVRGKLIISPQVTSSDTYS
tara:strand:+ start:887 stop:1246 length:360 start_codon:yes stop_codon:yes gene_type:complete